MSSTRGRGFASMELDKQREIASKGGKAAHAKGTAHQFTSDEAREAGRKGGLMVSRDREHMSAIGREGGQSRGKRQTPVNEDVVNSFVTSSSEPVSYRKETESDQRDEQNIGSLPQHEE